MLPWQIHGGRYVGFEIPRQRQFSSAAILTARWGIQSRPVLVIFPGRLLNLNETKTKLADARGTVEPTADLAG
jgi:hypothetical protein